MEEEILDVVDEKDKFVRKATREEVRKNALLHRTVRVIIKNSKREFLLQKRSKNKKNFPSHWDIGVAETVKSGESYEAAAIRGLVEETGILNISNIQLIRSFLFKIKYNSPQTNEYCKVYEILYDGKIKPQYEEIEEINFLPADVVKKLIREKPFHPVGKVVIEKYIENRLKK